MEDGVKMLEIIYDKISRKVIAYQEVEREQHDWVLQEGQGFVKLDIPKPVKTHSSIDLYLNSTLTAIDEDPNWVHPRTFREEQSNTKLEEANKATTVEELRQLVRRLIKDLYQPDVF